jgi:hypothetical protein
MTAQEPELNAIYLAKKCHRLLKLRAQGRFEAVQRTIRTLIEPLYPVATRR